MAAKTPKPGWYLSRATTEFLAKVGWPKKIAFAEFCLSKGVRGYDHGYTNMSKYLPVPRAVCDAMLAFLSKNKGLVLGPEHAPIQADSNDPIPTTRWPDILSVLFTDKPGRARQVRNPAAEIGEIAAAIVCEAGRTEFPSEDGLTDLERGQRVMGREVVEYARWLAMLHDFDPMAVCYAVTSDDRVASVTVSLVLTEVAAGRLLAGDLAEIEITRDDLALKGRHLYVNAAAPFDRTATVKAAEREFAELWALFTQGAFQTMGEENAHPSIYIIGGTERALRRLRRLQFEEMGTVKGTTKPLMVLRHHTQITERRASLLEMGSHTLLTAGYNLVRSQHREWYRDEAARRQGR